MVEIELDINELESYVIRTSEEMIRRGFIADLEYARNGYQSKQYSRPLWIDKELDFLLEAITCNNITYKDYNNDYEENLSSKADEYYTDILNFLVSHYNRLRFPELSRVEIQEVGYQNALRLKNVVSKLVHKNPLLQEEDSIFEQYITTYPHLSFSEKMQRGFF